MRTNGVRSVEARCEACRHEAVVSQRAGSLRSKASHDNLVGKREKRGRERQVEGSGRLEVQDKLEPRWLLEGQVRRRRAVEKAGDLVGEAATDQLALVLRLNAFT